MGFRYIPGLVSESREYHEFIIHHHRPRKPLITITLKMFKDTGKKVKMRDKVTPSVLFGEGGSTGE